jgi:hypothetical protein
MAEGSSAQVVEVREVAGVRFTLEFVVDGPASYGPYWFGHHHRRSGRTIRKYIGKREEGPTPADAAATRNHVPLPRKGSPRVDDRAPEFLLETTCPICRGPLVHAPRCSECSDCGYRWANRGTPDAERKRGKRGKRKAPPR